MSTTTAPAQAAREQLSGFRGELIGPEDAGYEAARSVYNAMIDKRPALIARCADADDVAAVIRFAAGRGLLLAVRGGGHNGAGLGTCDGGVVIDLSALKEIQVDPQGRSVRVGGGCTWGEVDRATNEHGLATPSGIISTTGVGGLTLGGGLGHLTRKCGLSIDNLLEAELVLASGERVTANADEHPDLYWAIRGGGGNFGVVTSFMFRLHDVDTVFAGPMFWASTRAPTCSPPIASSCPMPRASSTGSSPTRACRRRPRSPRSCTCARSAESSGATSAASRTRPRRWRRCSTTFPSPCCTVCRRCRTRRCRALSTRSIRRAISGTGARTSSRRSPTRRSTPMPGSALRCRLGSRPCTCTRSTGPFTTSTRPIPPGATATRAGARCSPALTPTRPMSARSGSGPSTTSRRCTRSRPVAPTST